MLSLWAASLLECTRDLKLMLLRCSPENLLFVDACQSPGDAANLCWRWTQLPARAA